MLYTRTMHNGSGYMRLTAKTQLPADWQLLILLFRSPLLGLGLFFGFLILYIVGRTPWIRDQFLARLLPTYGKTQTEYETRICD
jgi:hypothetical protein